MRNKFPLGIFAIALIVIGIASPALASDNPVTANATVNESLTVSGFSPTINFPPGNDGDTVTATNAEQYTVVTNSLNGVTINLETLTGQMADNMEAIPNSDLSIDEIGDSATQKHIVLTNLNAPNTIIPLYASDTAGTTNFKENWNLSIPANEPASDYHESFDYNIIPNS